MEEGFLDSPKIFQPSLALANPLNNFTSSTQQQEKVFTPLDSWINGSFLPLANLPLIQASLESLTQKNSGSAKFCLGKFVTHTNQTGNDSKNAVLSQCYNIKTLEANKLQSVFSETELIAQKRKANFMVTDTSTIEVGAKKRIKRASEKLRRKLIKSEVLKLAELVDIPSNRRVGQLEVLKLAVKTLRSLKDKKP